LLYTNAAVVTSWVGLQRRTECRECRCATWPGVLPCYPVQTERVGEKEKKREIYLLILRRRFDNCMRHSASATQFAGGFYRLNQLDAYPVCWNRRRPCMNSAAPTLWCRRLRFCVAQPLPCTWLRI